MDPHYFNAEELSHMVDVNWCLLCAGFSNCHDSFAILSYVAVRNGKIVLSGLSIRWLGFGWFHFEYLTPGCHCFNILFTWFHQSFFESGTWQFYIRYLDLIVSNAILERCFHFCWLDVVVAGGLTIVIVKGKLIRKS